MTPLPRQAVITKNPSAWGGTLYAPPHLGFYFWEAPGIIKLYIHTKFLNFTTEVPTNSLFQLICAISRGAHPATNEGNACSAVQCYLAIKNGVMSHAGQNRRLCGV